jgi:hypothetical protein
MPFEIRPYRDADLNSIYKICMQTADGGKDASHLFAEQQLIGDFYAVPYVILESDVYWVVSRDNQVCGYIPMLLQDAKSARKIVPRYQA